MKVNLDKQNSVRDLSFKGYEQEKSKSGGYQYTFNFPYDTNRYDGYVELCAVKPDQNGDYKIICGLPNLDIDVSNVPNDRKMEVAMALPLKSGKTVVNLSNSYGISEKSPFGYHFKLVPKGGGEPIYQVDAGDVMNLTNYGQAHDIFNIVVPGSAGSDVGAAILVIPDSYNAMYTYDKDGKVVPNLQYIEASKAVKHFSNKMGGSLAGIEHDLDAGKFDNYTKIVSTPLFTDDSLTPHSYWNINCMQMANSLGNIKNYQNLQKKLFAKGINWVSDGAFVNEGLQGVHFRHVLKWGQKSPYFNWFRAQNLKNKPLSLGVFPKNHDVIGFKVVNAPSVVAVSANGTATGVEKNKNYDKSKPTYIQVFDKRLVSENEAKDNSPLIQSYSKLDTGNPTDIVTHHDTVIPYSFEVDPDILTHNMENLIKYNKKLPAGEKLTKDSYQAMRLLSKFPNFSLEEKIEGGFDTWDANVDIAKINYVYSKENLKDLHNIMNTDDRDAYNQAIEKSTYMTQDYAITSASYWTKVTNKMLNLHVAQNLKNVSNFNAQEILDKINSNITEKQVFPIKVGEVVDKDVIQNVLDDFYRLKPQSKEEYKNVIIAGMMDLPLDSIELGENITSVLASPYITKRATHEDEIGVSRFDMKLHENSHLDDEYKETYLAANSVYEKEMFAFANLVLDELNKKLPKNLQLNDGANTSEYGKYVLPYILPEIAKFAVVKGLLPDAEVKIDNENGGVIYDYNSLKQTSLQQLGINANSPKQEAEMLIAKLKGSKFAKVGIPSISDKDRELLVNSLYKMIEGTNTTSFKLAEMIVDRSRAGLDWRIDATKDIADIESLRKGDTDFEDTWGQIIDFWSKFSKSVYKENPNSYLVAEVTNEGELHGAAGQYSPKYDNYKNVLMKFLRETGITSIANYGFFFTDVPALFGKVTENGDDWGTSQYDKMYNLMGSGYAGSNPRNDFLHSGPLPSLISSYTFADNHDKPRILHGFAMDMGLFYADLNCKTGNFNVNSNAYKNKETAYKVIHGRFMPNDTVEPYYVHNYDFSRISPKAVAMGDAMGNAFGKALETLTGGPDKTWTKYISDEQQNMAYKALAASISDLVRGNYDGQNFQSEAFGVRPFDIVVDMVVNQAVKKHGLKFSDNKSENEKQIKRLKNTMFWAALDPAITKALAVMKFLVALPGNATIFAGDDMGSTGYEQLTKNIYLQNRSNVHHEWLEEDSPEKLEFIQQGKAEFDKIMATRKRPELHALNDGAPVLLKQSHSVQPGSNVKINSLLRQSTDGSMVISLFNIAGANHNYRQKNVPDLYPVEIGAIDLDPSNDGAEAGLRCGLTPGTEFVDSKNPHERFEVRCEGNHYYIVNKDGGNIYINDNTKILYHVTPELKKRMARIEELRNAINENNNANNSGENLDGTYKKILDLRADKAPSFSGRSVKSAQLYNPKFNFVKLNAYNQDKTSQNGSKLSLLAR